MITWLSWGGLRTREEAQGWPGLEEVTCAAPPRGWVPSPVTEREPRENCSATRCQTGRRQNVSEGSYDHVPYVANTLVFLLFLNYQAIPKRLGVLAKLHSSTYIKSRDLPENILPDSD